MRINLMPPPRWIRREKLSGAIDAFLRALEASGASAKTIRAYKAALKSFQYYVGDKSLEDITESDYVEWLAWLRKQPGKRKGARRESTLHYYSIFVRRFLRWAGVVDSVPALPSRPGDFNDALSWDEVESLLAAAKDLYDVVIVALAAESGLRAGEILNLMWADVDLSRRLLRVKGKYGKERIVFLGPIGIWALAELAAAIRPRPSDRVVPMTYQALYKRVKAMARRAGLPEERIRPHTLRHTFATEALRRGVNLASLQRMLGHSDIKVTQRYLHLVTEDIERDYYRAFYGEEGVQGSLGAATGYPPVSSLGRRRFRSYTLS